MGFHRDKSNILYCGKKILFNYSPNLVWSKMKAFADNIKCC